jgi:hypothetical protein
MKHLDDFNKFSSINESKETTPIEIQVIGKSKDASVSQKKARSNVYHIADMLNIGNKYKIINSKSEEEEGNIITYLNILVQLTEDKVKSLENSISKFENAPFSIIKNNLT